MTPALTVLSVPHSGTQFTIELLKQHGYADMGLHGNAVDPVVRQSHCVKYGHVQRAVELAKQGVPLIMPLRHPFRVEESWRRREYPDHAEMFAAYTHMLQVLRPHVACWFPVDAAPLVRAVQADKLRSVADVTGLVVEWDRLINAKHNTHDIALSELKPSDQIRIVREHPLFTEFYGDKD